MRIWFACLLFAFFLLSKPVQAEGTCLVFGVPNHARHIELTNIISAAFDQAGICHQIKYAPSKRLTLLLKNGQIDGEFIRTMDYGAVVGDIAAPIDFPILTVPGVLITKYKNVRSLYDVEGDAVAIVRGHQWAVNEVAHLGNVMEVSDFNQLPELLGKDRIVGFLANEASWSEYKDKYPGFYTSFVRNLSAYIWLLRTHKDQEAKIIEALKNLDLEGFKK